MPRGISSKSPEGSPPRRIVQWHRQGKKGFPRTIFLQRVAYIISKREWRTAIDENPVIPYNTELQKTVENID